MSESVGIMTFPLYGNIKFMFQTTIQDWSKMPGCLFVTDPMDLLYSILFGLSNSNCLETFFFLVFLVYPPFLDEPSLNHIEVWKSGSEQCHTLGWGRLAFTGASWTDHQTSYLDLVQHSCPPVSSPWQVGNLRTSHGGFEWETH
jgi:hypothetical protein